MQGERSGWTVAARVAGWIDKLVDAAIAIMLMIALLYGSFGLWDTWNVYHNAGVDKSILAYRPSAEEGEDHPTLAQLQALYPDVCAWLTVDGTNIDYPIVQGSDNSIYLNQSVDGSFSLSGSIFLDYRNTRDFSDSYSLVYGHHMAGKVMFGEIPSFLEEEYFDEHPTGWLLLANKTYKIYWIACIQTDAYDKYVYQVSPDESAEVSQERLEYLKKNAQQFRDLGVTADDQLIALSTCSDATTDGRAVLIGWLCPTEEGVSESTS
jgi:sortase B